MATSLLSIKHCWQCRHLSNNLVTSIAEDAHGDIWVGTWGGGLDRFDWTTQQFVHYEYETMRYRHLLCL